MTRTSMLRFPFVRRAGVLLAAGVLAVGVVACDSDSGRMPRADSAADASRPAPGSQVGSTSAPSGPYAGSAAPSSTPSTSGPTASGTTPSGTTAPESTPSSMASSATPQGNTSATGSDLTPSEKSNTLPQPKQNNDHSTPPTVRGEIGKDGQSYPSGSGTSESGTPKS